MDNNLMYIANDKLYDTPGRTDSPYISQAVFAASTMKTRFETKGSLNFVFESDCFFTNTGLSINQLQVDADDGAGYRVVNVGSVFTASYSSGGSKDVKVKAKFSDGSTKYCHFSISVVKLSGLKSTKYYNTEVLPISSSTVRSYSGQKAGGEVTIVYNGETNVLDKPFIVFEGYDTWKILTPNDPSENFTWDKFLNRSDFQSYFNDNFQHELAARGYDLVFVDYDNGTDYIQRNAYFAQAVIKAVNQKKVGDQPNVVMGISMGGLVGRYALADMENRGEEHDTHMFISMDSPHQGANVPLGVQALVRHLTEVKLEVGIPALGLTGKVWDLGDVAEDYPAFINLLQQPATRQMLIEQLSGFGDNFYRDNSVREAFMQEYNQLGYPKKCRNIAVSNGSGAVNNSWQYNPGTDVFDLNGNCKGDWWTDFLGSFVIAAAPFTKQLWKMPMMILASFLPGKHGVKINYNIKTIPYSGTERIYHGRIRFYKKVLWLIKVSSTFTDESLDYTGNGLPWSSAMGGNQPMQRYTGTFSDQLPSCLNFTPPSQANFCFVPTVSALDIQGNRDLKRGYRAENDLQNSKFDNFYTEPTSNKIHTEFNIENSNWIITELDNDNLLRSAVYKMNNCAINGSDIICSGGTQYSISNFPDGAKLKWIYSNNITCSSPSDNFITMSANNSGNGWVRAEITGGGVVVYSKTKNVNVGPPNSEHINFINIGSNYPNSMVLCDDVPNDGTVEWNGLGSISEYFWSVCDDCSNDWEVVQHPMDLLFSVPMKSVQISKPYGSTCGYVNVIVKARNQCGWGEYKLPALQFSTNSCGGGGGWYMMSSPNPANEYTELNFYNSDEISEYQKSSPVMVSIPSNKQKGELGEYEIQIWHERKGLVKQMKLKSKKLQIPTNNLDEGIYFLHVIVNGKVHKQQLKIQR